MTKDELKALGLDEALAAKVAEASATELKEYVAKAKYDESQAQVTELSKQAKNHNTQLEELKKSAADSEALKAKITELQEAGKTAKEAFDKQLRDLKISNAVDAALAKAKAKNTKAAKALLDLSEFGIDDKGNVTGIDKQLKKLVEGEDTKFLFDTPPDPNGGKPDGGVRQDGGGKPDGGGEPGGGALTLGQRMAQAYNAVHAFNPESK